MPGWEIWQHVAERVPPPGLAGLPGELDQPVPFGPGHAVQLEKGPNVPGLGAAPSGLDAEQGRRRPLQLPRDLLTAHPGGLAAALEQIGFAMLAPKGAERSGNPWHVREYRAEEFAGLLYAHFSDVELHGLFHARKLRWHDWMLRAGWDALHPRVGLTGPFYSRFTPAIAETDFTLRRGVPAQLQRALDLVAVCRL